MLLPGAVYRHWSCCLSSLSSPVALAGTRLRKNQPAGAPIKRRLMAITASSAVTRCTPLHSVSTWTGGISPGGTTSGHRIPFILTRSFACRRQQASAASNSHPGPLRKPAQAVNHQPAKRWSKPRLRKAQQVLPMTIPPSRRPPQPKRIHLLPVMLLPRLIRANGCGRRKEGSSAISSPMIRPVKESTSGVRKGRQLLLRLQVKSYTVAPG